MRLWHTSLIRVLPREQLVAQWRELSACAGSIQQKETPNHILVNFIMEYDFDHFISYAYYVREEMTRRGYRTMDSIWKKIVALKPNYNILPFQAIYPEKMNDTYWIICYYNLKEKFLCGGISYKEWDKIEQIDLMLYH